MRRLAASFLLLLLCAGMTLPLLQAQGSSVPACCRRNGKHHCEMLPQGDGFRTAAPGCPYRSFTALTSHSTALSTVSYSIVRQLALREFGEDGCHLTLHYPPAAMPRSAALLSYRLLRSRQLVGRTLLRMQQTPRMRP